MRASLAAALLAGVAVAGCATQSPPQSAGETPPGSTVTSSGAIPTVAGDPSPIGTGGTPTSQRRPFVPALVRLPSGTTVPIDSAGVDATGVLAVPEDITRAGWWTGGARAGDPFGGVVVAGHVDSAAAGIGAMAQLNDVRRGADIVLSGSGERRTYRVQSSTQVPKARLSAELGVFDQVVPERLVLITCGGAFDPVARHYADNLVVIATPV